VLSKVSLERKHSDLHGRLTSETPVLHPIGGTEVVDVDSDHRLTEVLGDLGNLGGIVALTLGLILLKMFILLVLARVFNVAGSDKFLFGLGLAQAGEFGFVLLSFTVANQVIPVALADQLLLVVALSMLLTPALFIAYERLIVPRMSAAQRDPDEIDDEAPIIIAGHGRWGGIVNRMLVGAGYKTVVLDHSSAQLEALRAFGIKVFYGDASRPDLLHAAGIEEAKMLVVAIDDRDLATQIVHHVAQTHPHVYIIARAVDRNHVYELYAAGCRDIIREIRSIGRMSAEERQDRMSGPCGCCKWFSICGGGFRTRAAFANDDLWGSDPGCYLHEDEIADAVMA